MNNSRPKSVQSRSAAHVGPVRAAGRGLTADFGFTCVESLRGPGAAAAIAYVLRHNSQRAAKILPSA